MKKTAQNILFFISGIIFMCIAITPLVYFYAAFHGEVGFDYLNFQRNTRFFLELFTFIYVFLSVNFLILGLNLFVSNKIEKIFSIKRIFYVLIIMGVFWYILMTILVPPMFFLQYLSKI